MELGCSGWVSGLWEFDAGGGTQVLRDLLHPRFRHPSPHLSLGNFMLEGYRLLTLSRLVSMW